MTKLLGLQYQIVYKPSTTNRAADALSRGEQKEDGEFTVVSTVIPDWMEAIASGYQNDPQSSKLLQDLTISGNGTSKFQLSHGILKSGNRVWVGNNAHIQHNIKRALHSIAVGGHSGFQVTYHCIRKMFVWLGIKQMVREYNTCIIQGYYNHCWFQTMLGRLYPWILSKVCHDQLDSIALWW